MKTQKPPAEAESPKGAGPPPPDDDRTAWHTAFIEAIQMELDEYSGDLQFLTEYQLAAEPLRIDAVIIKKHRDIAIKKTSPRYSAGTTSSNTKAPAITSLSGISTWFTPTPASTWP